MHNGLEHSRQSLPAPLNEIVKHASVINMGSMQNFHCNNRDGAATGCWQPFLSKSKDSGTSDESKHSKGIG